MKSSKGKYTNGVLTFMRTLLKLDEKNEVVDNAKNILYKITKYPSDSYFIINKVIREEVEKYCVLHHYSLDQIENLYKKIDAEVCKNLSKEYRKHLSMINILNVKSKREFIYENVFFAIKMIAIICIMDLIGIKNMNISLCIVGYTIGSILFNLKSTFINNSKSFNLRRKIKLYNTL
ncbi:TPA: hypothetical protein I9080_002089 [Clostridium perfringens]|uniref:Uncharacterized protein n=1 Tax=Clostridium perfringens TaxID=1502 RepID=A0A8H9QY87_CLOPF|nr:hypothetical protein [Clostridium perfringens]